MRTRTAFHSLLALVAVASVASCKKGSSFGSGFEGVITLRTTRGSDPPADLVVKAKGERLRFETVGRDGTKSAAIYVPEKQKVVLVFDATRSTMDLDLSHASAAPNTSATASDVEDKGTKETVAGVECEDYEVTDPSGRKTKTCIAKGIAYFDIASLRSPTGGTQWSHMMHQQKMFPLRTIELDAQGREISRTEATSIESQKLDDAIFEVPKGYLAVGHPVY